jgi:hypothetical protein
LYTLLQRLRNAVISTANGTPTTMLRRPSDSIALADYKMGYFRVLLIKLVSDGDEVGAKLLAATTTGRLDQRGNNREYVFIHSCIYPFILDIFILAIYGKYTSGTIQNSMCHRKMEKES